MSGANGDALEWAVALLHAPGERHALRQRPLPDGITELLGIAATTSPESLAIAAKHFGEPESRMREAAQFYVREILLFPQADAYRILGVSDDASQDVIKTHHRLLQRWLHPDRLQHAGDAVFAARVNVAWQRLRNTAQRAQYDAHLRQTDHLPAALDIGAMPVVRVWGAEPPPVPPLHRWLRRLPLLMLLLVCGGLFWMVLQDWRREPELAWGEPDVASAPAQAQSAISSTSQPVTKAARHQHAAPPDPRVPAATAAHVKPGRMASALPVVPSHGLGEARAASIPMTTTASPVSHRNSRSSQPGVTAPAVVADMTMTAPVVEPISPPHAALPSQAQIAAAQQVADQLLRYMQQLQRPSPSIWNSLGIQISAEQMRKTLNAAGAPRFGAVQWRIGTDAADLVSRFPSQPDGSGGGTFTAVLQWREGRWLVTGVGMGQEQ